MFHKLTDAVAENIKTVFANVEIKAAGDEYMMIISKEIPDRDGDVVVLAGMDAKNYKKNPVVLINHDYRIESIVGKTKSLEQQGSDLVARFVFADTERGQLAKKLYDSGFLKTASIGFIVRERDPNDRSRFTKWELLEWSLVAVPANPGALSLDGKAFEGEEYQKALEFGLVKCESCGDTPPEKPTETPATKEDIEEVKAMIADLQNVVKTLANSKAMDDETEKALAQKELLQSINRATSEALAGLKRLK